MLLRAVYDIDVYETARKQQQCGNVVARKKLRANPSHTVCTSPRRIRKNPDVDDFTNLLDDFVYTCDVNDTDGKRA